jgi:hypothetical protein
MNTDRRYAATQIRKKEFPGFSPDERAKRVKFVCRFAAVTGNP